MISLLPDIRVKCPPDDRPVRVRRRPEKAFPFFFANYSGKVDAVLKMLEGLDSAKLAVDVKRIQSALTYELDEVNRSLMPSFRFCYEMFRADPCGKIDWLTDKVDQLINEDQKARYMFGTMDRVADLARAGLANESVLSILEQLIAALQINAPITNQKLEEAPGAIDRWAGRPDHEAALGEGMDEPKAGDDAEDEEDGA